MLPGTAYAQMDIQYQREYRGEKLLPDFHARGLDGVRIGRFNPKHLLKVLGFDSNRTGPHLWAVPGVVFLQK